MAHTGLSVVDAVLAAMRAGAVRWEDATVRGAYDVLAKQLEQALGDDAIYDGEPLTETQLVFVRHALRSLSGDPAAIARVSRLRAVAGALQTAAENALPTALPKTAVPQVAEPDGVAGMSRLSRRLPQPRGRSGFNIGTISGGNVNITGIAQDYRSYSPPELDQMPVYVSDEVLDAPTRHKFDVFISYDRRDAERLRRLKTDLGAHGLTVWTDENLVVGTPSWMHAIEEAIRASGCVIVLLSPDSKKSEWVEKELVTAKVNEKQILGAMMRGDEKHSVPFLLCNVQWVDMRTEKVYRTNFRKLLRSIREHIQGAGV